MTAEFIKKLDRIVCMLVSRKQDGAQLTRVEQVVVDVYGAIGHIEGDGIHQFWDGADDGNRVLESFRILGVSEVADHLDSIRWAHGKDIYENCHYRFTPDEEAQLDKAEARVYELFSGLPTRLLEYARQRGIL